MSYGYPSGSQPFPGAGGQQLQTEGGYGTGQGWQQQPPQAPPQGGYQGLRYGQAPPPASEHYGSYGSQTCQNAFSIQAWQALNFSQEDDLEARFRSQMSPVYQAVQARELMILMNETPQIRNYYRITWSMELCKIMIAMLDRNKDGMMQFPEFKELLQCLTHWYTTFKSYDHNQSDYMEAQEIGKCIRNRLGYSLSAKAMECILKRYARVQDDGNLLIAFDDFVSLCVRLRAYTEAFRGRDRLANGRETGSCCFTYDDFIQCTMCL